MSDAYFDELGLMMIKTKLAGVTYDNRQDSISRCHDCDTLELIREPDNPYDSNAIRVMDAGRTLGYIPAAQAATLAPYMDAGEEIANCFIDRITGGDLNLGVNITILLKDNWII